MRREYQICTVCVMDTTDPEIVFDSDGVCNHCKSARKRLLSGWFPNDEGQRLLATTAKQIRESSDNKQYDCIVGMSGGIDSSYLLHMVIKKMSLRPLVVHIDAGWNSEEAEHNIDVMTKKLGLSLVTHHIDWEEMKDLQKAYLRSALANQDVPQDHAFFARLYNTASEYNIKYLITGSNLTSESILPSAWGYHAMDSYQLKAIHRRFGQQKLQKYPVLNFFKYKFYYPYLYRMKIVSPLNWIDYNKNSAIEFLQREYGWKYYGGKHHESKWTRFFQTYYLPMKFGYDKRRAHLSSMIVASQVSRDDAIAELSKPPVDDDTANADKRYVASMLDLSVDELENLIDLPNKTFEEYPNTFTVNKVLRSLKRIIKI